MMMRYLRSSSSSLHGLGESPVPASSIVVIYDLKLKCYVFLELSKNLS
jgi:hypothetical protein